MKDIPDFLVPFAEKLNSFKRESIKINAKPLKKNILNDPLKITQSKFLGFPFFPKKDLYPKDKNGKNMILICQLNFKEIPNFQNFPSDGILQLYLSPDNWYNDDYKIIYHTSARLDEDCLSDFSFLDENDYDESPMQRIHKLEFIRTIENGGLEDSQFKFTFNGEPSWEYVDRLNEEQQIVFGEYFDSSGHKLGGYADFTQSDPRDYGPNHRDDLQILQIDMDDYIMFGDSGLGHIFINKEDLIKCDFEKAYFYWDCC